MWIQRVLILFLMCSTISAICQVILDINGEYSCNLVCTNTTFDDLAYDVAKTLRGSDKEYTGHGTHLCIINSEFSIVRKFVDVNFDYALSIKISQCNVSLVDENAFRYFPKLQVLDLSFNKIENLKFITRLPHALLQLILKNNKIKNINFSFFNHQLETLDLSFNEIAEIRFSNLTAFPVKKFLNVNNNRIKIIDMPPTMEGVRSLSINMANNPLRIVANCEPNSGMRETMSSLNLSNSLMHLSVENITTCNLRFCSLILHNNKITLDNSLDLFVCESGRLDFSNTSLTHIPRGMFEGYKFASLNLSYNNLESLNGPVFSGIVLWKHLDLSNCKIKNVSYLLEGIDSNKVNLTGNHIAELNSNSFRNIVAVHDLNLSFNNLKLKNNSFVNCKGLSSLILSNSNISLIEEDAFKGLTNVTILHLENNTLKSLPSNVFKHLLSITEIYLQNNPLTVLRSGLFSSVPLRIIKLSGNNIELIEHRAFYNLPNIKYISINNNSALLSIEKHAFFDLPLLEKVNLSDSGLTRANLKIFRNTSSLKIIDAKDNNITSIDFSRQKGFNALQEIHLTLIGDLKSKVFLELNSLNILTFWNSKIKTVRRRAFHGLFHLKLLQIRNSEISLMEDGAFDGLFDLMYLYLGNNINHEACLGSLTFPDLFSLIELNLSSQGLQRIFPNAFKGLYNLRYLFLSSNNLSRLNDSTFAGLTKLKTLDLSYNMLTYLESGSFRGLDALTSLNLSNNNVNVFELGVFQHFPKLASLNLNDNKLTEFKIGTFSNLYNLRYLDLARNNISTLRFESFLVLIALVNLNLEFNNLKTFGQYDLISNLKTLRGIRIAKNKWQCEYLEKMLLIFRKNNVKYSSININFYDDNVDGIECIDICKYLLCLKDSHGIN